MNKLVAVNVLNLVSITIGIAVILGMFDPLGKPIVWTAIAVQFLILGIATRLLWRALHEA